MDISNNTLQLMHNKSNMESIKQGNPREVPRYIKKYKNNQNSNSNLTFETKSIKSLNSRKKSVQNKKLHTIYLSRVPAHYLNFSRIQEHFESFGTITGIQIQRAHLQCFITFSSEEEAQRAIDKSVPVFGKNDIEIRFAFYDKRDYLTLEIAQKHFAALTHCKAKLVELVKRLELIRTLRNINAKNRADQNKINSEEKIALERLTAITTPFFEKIGRILRDFCTQFPADPNESLILFEQISAVICRFDAAIDSAFGPKGISLLSRSLISEINETINSNEFFAETLQTGVNRRNCLCRRQSLNTQNAKEREKTENDTELYEKLIGNKRKRTFPLAAKSTNIKNQKRLLSINNLPPSDLCNKFVRDHFYKYGFIEKSLFQGNTILLLYATPEMAEKSLLEKNSLNPNIQLKLSIESELSQ